MKCMIFPYEYATNPMRKCSVKRLISYSHSITLSYLICNSILFTGKLVVTYFPFISNSSSNTVCSSNICYNFDKMSIWIYACLRSERGRKGGVKRSSMYCQKILGNAFRLRDSVWIMNFRNFQAIDASYELTLIHI